MEYMARREQSGNAALITTARFSRSLDTDERNKRYLITMLFRVVFFLAAVLAPSPWRWVLLIASAVLPPIAVMLANAVDLRTPPEPVEVEPTSRLALTAGEIIAGDVVEQD